MLVNTRWLAPLATSHDTFKASRGMKLEAAHCCGERERGDGGGGREIGNGRRPRQLVYGSMGHVGSLMRARRTGSGVRGASVSHIIHTYRPA